MHRRVRKAMNRMIMNKGDDCVISKYYQSVVDERAAITLGKFTYSLAFIFFVVTIPRWNIAVLGFSVTLGLTLLLLLFTRTKMSEQKEVYSVLESEGYVSSECSIQALNQAMVLYMAHKDIQVPTVSGKVYLFGILIFFSQILIVLLATFL